MSFAIRGNNFVKKYNKIPMLDIEFRRRRPKSSFLQKLTSAIGLISVFRGQKATIMDVLEVVSELVRNCHGFSCPFSSKCLRVAQNHKSGFSLKFRPTLNI